MVVDPVSLPPVLCGFERFCPGETHFEPDVAGLDDGGYVITWNAEFRGGGTTGVYARRYAADGSAVGPSTLIAPAGLRPAVSGIGGGAFVIVWDTFVSIETGTDVFARRFGPGELIAPS